MKTIIAGSRGLSSASEVWKAIDNCGWVPTTVVCGGARGADTFGAEWAIENNVPIEYHYPDWSKYGRRAGLLRNIEMASVSDALIAVWDGTSKGTGHMIDTARAKGLKIHVELF